MGAGSSVSLRAAEEWDNVGLLLGDARREVSGCVVALDATEEALDFARARGANLLLRTIRCCFARASAWWRTRWRRAFSAAPSAKAFP